jgi:anaphase-promoting complex subunit 1
MGLPHVSDPTLCCRIKEGNSVNLDVTAPGATVALGLMFLKTNNASVAARLSVPKTHFLLQYLRPDLVLLRVLARNLVMWDSIEPTSEFVESLIPDIVKGPHTLPQHDLKDPRESGGGESLLEDSDTLRHVHANILAGCCLSIGLRYAGSAERKAADLLIGYIEHFKKLRSWCDGHRRVDKQLIETCIAIAALSASLVLAGTGDLILLRHLRCLRGRVESDLHYGHHMAFSMAIGMLFLGGGRATLCTSNEAIAALVIALYPRFPISTSDCRYHLQAFRHLYVLAVEHRCLETIDLHSDLLCTVPVEIILRPMPEYKEAVLRRMTPCILPELDRVKTIRILSERYWGVTWDVERDGRLAKALRKGCVLTVQRKTGHLSYSDDPFGLRNLHARPMTRHSNLRKAQDRSSNSKDRNRSWDCNNPDLIQSFSGDPAVLAFAQYLAAGDHEEMETQGGEGSMDRRLLQSSHTTTHTQVPKPETRKP